MGGEVTVMKETLKKKVSVSMPQELYEQLKILSQENCYTLPGYIRQVLKVHVREQGKK